MLLFKPSGRLVLSAVTLWLVGAALVIRLGSYSRLTDFAPGLAPPEERFSAAPADITEYLERLGEAGRVVYRQAQWLDFLNATLLAVALGLLVLWLVQRLPEGWHWLSWLAALPVAAGAADAIENLHLLGALARFPAPPSALLPTLTTAKHLLGMATMGILLLLSVLLLVEWLRARTDRPRA